MKKKKNKDDCPFPYTESMSDPLTLKDSVRILKNIEISGYRWKERDKRTCSDGFLHQTDTKLVNKAIKAVLKKLKKLKKENKKLSKSKEYEGVWSRKGKHGPYTCPKCGKEALFDCIPATADSEASYCRFPSRYCPACGARLRHIK